MLLALGFSAVLAQPFAPGQGVLPSGANRFAQFVNFLHRAQTYQQRAVAHLAWFLLLQALPASPTCMRAGNLLTSDPGGPYNFSLLNTQTTEVRGMSSP